MDSNEGGLCEDSGSMGLVLTRKPYTITKQRKRWTEEEHHQFLEALKLYGRAWQKIEEHIGTKTAVQIRSHAQKFFTKLEKEAVNKGVPIGQTQDIKIPPPRPKRKPSNPYPRKTSAGSLSQGGGKEGKQSTAGSPLRSPFQNENHILDLEKEPLIEITEDSARLENVDECQTHNSEFSNLLQVAQHPSQSSPYEDTLNFKKSENSCTFIEFVPSLRESINEDEPCKSILTNGNCKEGQRVESDRRPSSHDNGNSKMLEFMNLRSSHDKRTEEDGHPSNFDSFLLNEIQVTQNYPRPRHVPVHILDGSLGMSAAKNITSEIAYQESIHSQMGGHCAKLSISCNPTIFAPEHQRHAPKCSVHQTFCNFLPDLPPILNQYDYRTCAHASSTFSSPIVSALLQNPAAHAAARFAATFLPCATVEAPGDENTTGEGFPSQHIRADPSMTAIVGATVAAATAWWAANGLLPFCSPFDTAFSYSATSASIAPMGTTQAKAVKCDQGEAIRDAHLQDQQLDPECSEAPQELHSGLRSPSVSTFNSEGHEDAKQSDAGVCTHEVEEIETVTQLNDSDNLKSRKLVDRSSCGSNTPSSSEVETDALEKHEKGKELQEYDIDHQTNDSSTRHCRSFSNVNDSLKEVSEGGRMAFRDVLPQSFYYHRYLKNDGNRLGEDMQPTSNFDVHLHSDDQHMIYKGSTNRRVEDMLPLIGENNWKEGLPTLGIDHATLKTRRTGFKPYKRCSIEANDGRVANCSSMNDDKCPKRIRVEGEAAST